MNKKLTPSFYEEIASTDTLYGTDVLRIVFSTRQIKFSIILLLFSRKTKNE